MNSQDKREEIIELIENIKDHSDLFADRPVMPLLELNAILSKINKLHEATVILKFLLAKEKNHEEELHKDKVVAEEAKIEEELVGEENIQMEGDASYIEEESLELEMDEEESIVEKAIIEEAESSEKELIESSENLMEIEVEEEIIESIENELESNEEFSSSDINEHYSESEENRLEGKLKNLAIEDILASIGLNERYLYSNELFDGEMELFKEEVNVLNSHSSFEEAKQYWDEMLEKYGWESENVLVESLFKLVERRFVTSV